MKGIPFGDIRVVDYAVKYVVVDHLQQSDKNGNDESAPYECKREVNVGVLGFHSLLAQSNLLNDVLNFNDRVGIELHNTCTKIEARADTQEAEDASKGSKGRANEELSYDFDVVDLFEENIVQSGEVGADCWIRREFYT